MITRKISVAKPVVRLADYQPPDFLISATELELELGFSETWVRAQHQVQRRPTATQSAPLALDMECLALQRVAIDGVVLEAGQYRVADDRLILADVPDKFELDIENTIAPNQNTALSGLYQSADMLCTQCEAEGFRRITPAIDRPDNLSVYRVTLRGDKKTFPRLLCNGNLVAQGENADGSHYAVWHDPFPKPTYLFAIVAGRLECLEDSFVTEEQRTVALRFFARGDDIKKCAYAMDALKRAFAWDERAYGRAYDLDVFNVVAVEDFNMGAMENKSLNIFNTQYVLADSAVATDADFDNVESVIGHEYFHNWSGNRVTCRDWFQLSLKEGFTVFRDQQFSADMGSAAVKRIDDVAVLRSHQFPEDAGPMAHPVRPDSYMEINNFYTATVYNKGAEVIRMLHTLLGAEKFRRGTDLYFARHDGQAVTTDDFVAAMAEAGEMDLRQFKRWYQQSGTPVVEVESEFDPAGEEFTLTLRQYCRPNPAAADSFQEKNQPFVIPVRAALFDADGGRIAAKLRGADPSPAGEDDVLILNQAQQSFTYSGVKTAPVASLLRGFSAPVELRQNLEPAQLAFLLAHDDDPFNRWEAGQQLFLRDLLARVAAFQKIRVRQSGNEVLGAFAKVLADANGLRADPTTTTNDEALLAALLTLPQHDYLCEQLTTIDPHTASAVRRDLKIQLADSQRTQLRQCYESCAARNDGTRERGGSGVRALRDVCLGYLVSLGDEDGLQLALDLAKNARCMSDSIAALYAIVHATTPTAAGSAQTYLDEFYARWKDEPLVVNKWLRVQATAPKPDALARVQALTAHPAFDPRNPNKVYALLAAFCYANPSAFHATDGSGYEFIAQWVAKLDPHNPQVSARLASALGDWQRYIPRLRTKMRSTLEQIAKLPKLSSDVSEIVAKCLP